jgi:type IV pilus assembly protein PilB
VYLAELLRCLTEDTPGTPDSLVTAFGHVARKVGDALSAQAVVVLMLDAAGQRAYFQNIYFSSRLYGRDERKQRVLRERQEQLKKTQMNCPSSCPIWESLRKGESVVIPGSKEGAQCRLEACQPTGIQMHSLLAAPLRVDSVTVGCVEVVNKTQRRGELAIFTSDDLALVERMARCGSLALRRVLSPQSGPSETEVAQCLAEATLLPFVELEGKYDPDYALLHNLGEEKLRRFGVLPVARIGERGVRAVLANPLNTDGLQDFETVTGLRVAERAVVRKGEVERVLERAFSRAVAGTAVGQVLRGAFPGAGAALPVAPTEEEEEDEEEAVNEASAPIIQLANFLVEDAHQHRASDIHIEPQGKQVCVRYRIDGVCVIKHTLPRNVHRPLVSRLKIMSNLDIAERRLPQDGRIDFQRFQPTCKLDLRISVIPSNYGETVVMRLLDKQSSTLPLDELGFSEYNLTLYRHAIQVPYGMVLHCGPTGSGKSTTLYAALNEVNSPEKKILTAEDPIEYTLPGIVQVQVHRDIGLTFASCLRSFLRQDPDIILVGEIRDRETADIALEAAQTGHLLFSTLHTNDAAATVVRLTEMGIEPFLISSCLIGVCAQRLVRRLCHCRKEREPRPEEREMLGKAPGNDPIGMLGMPVGCHDCDQLGYRGRIGVHELLSVNDELREMISRGMPTEELKSVARRHGMRTLFEDAMAKVKAGVSSLPEALSVVAPD